VKRYVGGGIVTLLGVVILAGVLISGNTSPRGWIGSHYTRTGAGAYRASAAPLKVAGEITRKFKPSDRAYDPAGVFLRYPGLVVAVLPDGRGSRILVDDEDRGYRRHYAYIGSRWGGLDGRATLFRGGGPGEGK
jgi:Domain of unknown function (DUF4247)